MALNTLRSLLRFSSFVLILKKLYSEFRVEYLNPPYMSVAQPQLLDVPAQIQFNQTYQIRVSIPQDVQNTNLQGKT